MPTTPRRAPTWSDAFTRPMARAIPPRARPAALAGIKAIHTVLFASIGGAIAWFFLDGVRQRPGRGGAVALSVALAETAVYVSNNQVCPLTPLAEEIGAQSGSVVDIFLPDWAARRIPLVSGTALLAGIALNVVAMARVAHQARASSSA